MPMFPCERMVMLKDAMFPPVMCSKRFVSSWSLTFNFNALWALFHLLFFLPFKASRIDNMCLLTLPFCVSMY